MSVFMRYRLFIFDLSARNIIIIKRILLVSLSKKKLLEHCIITK